MAEPENEDRTGASERETTGPEPGPKGTAAPASTGTPLTQQVGRVVMLVAAVLFGVFAVANFDQVRFSYLFGEADIPLFVLLIVSFVLGALIAWIATVRSERRKHRTAPPG